MSDAVARSVQRPAVPDAVENGGKSCPYADRCTRGYDCSCEAEAEYEARLKVAADSIPDDTFIGIGPDGKRWTAGELRAEARREAEQAEADAWYKAELERLRERAPA